LTWIAFLIIPATAVYILLSAQRHGLFTPGTIFAGMNVLAAISILPLLNPGQHADQTHGFILLYVGLSFPAFALLFELAVPRQVDSIRESHSKVFVPKGGAHGLILISVLITVAYFFAVGYSALFLGIQNAISGGSADIAGLRLDSYAGKRYLFPGYVNQFKNVLLPSLVVLTLTYWNRRGKVPVAMSAFLLLVATFGLLGTGQRAAFIIFAVTTLVYLYLANRNFSIKRLAVIMVVTLMVLMTSTFALGRSGAELKQAHGIVGTSGVLLAGLGNRIFSQGGEGKVAGFEYIYNFKPMQDGREWGQSVAGLLPGNRGSTLANEIFAYQWGSTRGNSPPSVWADTFHNFGWFGVLALPPILALIFAWITRLRGRRLPHANTLEVIGIAGVAVVIGMWTSGSPVVLLNNGLLMFALMWFVGMRMERDATTVPRSPHASSAKALHQDRRQRPLVRRP
jgi:oligosaccharide repeat unit polymerase